MDRDNVEYLEKAHVKKSKSKSKHKKNSKEKIEKRKKKEKKKSAKDYVERKKYKKSVQHSDKEVDERPLERESWMLEKHNFEEIPDISAACKIENRTSTLGRGSAVFKKPSEDSFQHSEMNIKPKTKGWQKSIDVQPLLIASNEAIDTNLVSKQNDIESAQNQRVNCQEKSYGQQINELSAKILKAQIMGNIELSTKLAENLAVLQNQFENEKKLAVQDDISSNQTTQLNMSRTMNERSVKKGKRAHGDVRRGNDSLRSFLENDKYDIKQMFQHEKYTTSADSNMEFIKMTVNPMRDVDVKEAAESTFQKRLKHSMDLHQSNDNCKMCFDSPNFQKKLLISMGSTIYLTLPWHIGLQAGHCLLVPVLHTCASTYLDKDAWDELTCFRQSLVKMFAAQGKEVLFFEIAKSLKRKKHMKLHCVPIPKDKAELAPFYFKKAIDESEHEWSMNNQLVSLRNKDVRSSIPKGLPYFWINFGNDYGFAHVIEDESHFPTNFAEGIIGGMLNLDVGKWRKQSREIDVDQKRISFCNSWKKYENVEKAAE